MYDNFWEVFRDTGEPMCFLLSKADDERRPVPEITGIPEEFKMYPPTQPAPTAPR